MKFLMEVYPEYVNRRLQQAHADYEYALRNQMIDSWGINTFDDLYFKYMVEKVFHGGRKLNVVTNSYEYDTFDTHVVDVEVDGGVEIGPRMGFSGTSHAPRNWSIVVIVPKSKALTGDGRVGSERAARLWALFVSEPTRPPVSD